MASIPSRPHATAVLPDDDLDVLAPTCPMCHTSAALSQRTLAAGGDWRCVRCGQRWDAARLAADAAYAARALDHDRAGTRGTEARYETALVGSFPIERPGGKP